MKLSPGILSVLAGAVPDGNLLRLPRRLPPGLYKKVDEALTAAGGRWDKRQQAHVFPGLAAEAVAGLRAAGEVTTARDRQNDAQFFPTPPEVTERLITLAGLGPDHEVLEPSAGTGPLAAAAAAIAAAVDCVERDPGYAAELRAAGYARSVTVADFLTIPPVPRYDRVVMNPPFTRGADVRHVRHALRFTRPGGRLTAVMLPGLARRKDRASKALSELISTWGGWYEDVPAGAFSTSGTPIATVITVIPVPGGPLTREAIPGSEAVRVTTDVTAWREPLFVPAAAAPGVYVHDSWAGSSRVFRFTGHCIGCGAKTWAHDDGDDDPRGPFGPHTGHPITSQDFGGDAGVPEDAAFPECAGCRYGDYERHQAALDRALAALRAAPRPQPVTAGRPVQLALFGG